MAGATGKALNQWRDLSDRELSAVSLTACAENIQWLLDRHHLEDDRLVIEGWAITMSGPPEKAQFLINGNPIEEVHYPIPSPDLGEIFWNIPTAQTARFVCKTTIDWEHTYPNGFACLEFLTGGSDREKVRRRAWYLPNPMDNLPVPEEARIRRAIGVPDSASFVIGGAAVYKRFEHYLKDKFFRTFDDFSDILDWACGCGRVARNFRWARGAKLWGVDIDGDNIAWCRKHLRHAQFLQVPPLPPLPFPAESFDLVMAISAFGQLTEELQLAWLQELKRVARKDAIVLIAIRGLSNFGLIRPHPGLLRKVEERGFLVTGPNNDLDDVMPGHPYISVLHSRDYIHTNWEKYFTITDIVDAIAANDDLIVLKNDKPAQVISVNLPALEPEIESGRENPFALPLRDYDINPFIHPTMVKSGYRGHLVDMNGTDYVDFMSAWGTNLLGYGYRKVARAAARQAKRFNILGLPYPQFQELMGLLRRLIPTAEEVRYGKNGSDACAGAVRLVRAITRREKILYRGYHGFHDWYFAATDCPGIPASLKATVISQPELTPAAVDAVFKQHPNEIAGLILNPLVGPYPTSDQMREVIEVIHRHGGLVIFDEIITGFRVAPGGMQELWDVKPDLSCFGKSISNGLPLAVLCGKSEYMRRLPETYYGMTFEGEAVSIAAAHATLTEIIEKNVIAALYEKGRRIRAEYQRLAAVYDLSTSLVGFEPCMHMDFQSQSNISGRQLLWLMNQELVRNGIFTLGAFLLCFSHDRRDLQKLESAFDSAMSVLRQAIDRGTTQGLLDERIRQCMDDIKSPATWRRASNEDT